MSRDTTAISVSQLSCKICISHACGHVLTLSRSSSPIVSPSGDQTVSQEVSSRETRAPDIRAPSSRFTYAPPPPRTGKYMRLMIYGYMLPDEFLHAYATEHNMGPVVTEGDKLSAYTNAVLAIKTEAGLYFRGMIAIIHPPHRERKEYCLFVASNKSELAMRLPEETYMEKLKKALGTEDPPQWYRPVSW